LVRDLDQLDHRVRDAGSAGAAYGLRVTAVCPGVVETPILDEGGPDDLPKSAAAGHTRAFFRHV